MGKKGRKKTRDSKQNAETAAAAAAATTNNLLAVRRGMAGMLDERFGNGPAGAAPAALSSDRNSDRYMPKHSSFVEAGRSFAPLRSRAEEAGLLGLARQCTEYHGALTEGEVSGVRVTITAAYNGMMRSSAPATDEEMLKEFSSKAHATGLLLDAVSVPGRAAWLAEDETRACLALEGLTPDVAFDMGMISASMEGVMGKLMADQNRAKNEADIRAFAPKALGSLVSERGRPELNKLKCALDEHSGAKSLLKRAAARLELARRARSEGIGYNAPAVELLHDAAADARAASKVRPDDPAPALVLAETLLAIGPEFGVEAAKVLQPHVGASAVARSAHRDARLAARSWIVTAPKKRQQVGNEFEADRRVERALSRLKQRCVAALDREHANPKALGDAIVDAIEDLRAVLRLHYHDRARFPLEKGPDDAFCVQRGLRRCARVVPLRVLRASERLRGLAFISEPWTCFGLDRAERTGSSSPPPFGSDDPFKVEAEKEKEGDEIFREIMQRKGGSTGGMVGMSDVCRTLEFMHGRGALADHRDMTPHNIHGPFSSTLLQRLVMTSTDEGGAGGGDGTLWKQACSRVVDLMTDELGSWAGGEFLGFALHTCAGLGKWGGVGKCESRRKWFLGPNGPRGGLQALCKEIGDSGDHPRLIQRAFAAMSPADFAAKPARDTVYVLSYYCLAGLDGFLNRCQPRKSRSHVTMNAQLDEAGDASRQKMIATQADSASSSFDTPELRQMVGDETIDDLDKGSLDNQSLVTVLSNIIDSILLLPSMLASTILPLLPAPP